MLKKSSFGIVFNTLFSVVFSGVLSIFIKLTQTGSITFESFMMAFIPAFAINFVLGSYIPLVNMGNAFAKIFVKNEKNPAFYFLRILSIVFVMVILMCGLLMFSEMGFSKEFIKAVALSFPMIFAFSYVLAVIVFPFILKMTNAICSKQ